MEIEYQIIKRNDNFCTDENQFISLLETNQCYKILKEKSVIEYKGRNIKYNIKKYGAKENEEIMFIVNFSVEDENQIEEFEKFDKSFLDFISKFNDFSFNILWDDISKSYAEGLYPHIAYIENLLRKIIYYFMGKNVGNNWTKKCFPKEVENSIKNVKDKNQAETDENILYYADFIQLSILLFKKYPNEVISQNELMEKLKDEKCDINEMISKYENKSNWDRYFQPVVDKENLEENLNSLYVYRNLVAHNRKIRNFDKKDAETTISKIKKVLDKCLKRIDEINVPEDEKENLENMSCQIFSFSQNNFEGFSGIKSFLNTYKIVSQEFSPISSMTENLKSTLETASIAKNVVDSAKLNFKMDLPVMEAMNALKIDTSATSIAKNMVDSAKANFKIESPVKDAIEAMKNSNPILALNSPIDKKDEDKK